MKQLLRLSDILLQPGPNRINFPETGYRFGRHEHCFVVEVDIERTRRPVDIAKELCARRVNGSWTLSRLEGGIGPFLIESLDMRPDPVKPDQKVRFWVKLRNDGSPIRADIRIQNRGEIITQVTEVLIQESYGEYLLPQTVFPFERFEPCFTVIVDSGRTPHRFDSKRDFCAKAYGHPLKWTLKP